MLWRLVREILAEEAGDIDNLKETLLVVASISKGGFKVENVNCKYMRYVVQPSYTLCTQSKDLKRRRAC